MRIVLAEWSYETREGLTGYYAPVPCRGRIDLRSIPDQSASPFAGQRNFGLFFTDQQHGFEIPDRMTQGDRLRIQSTLGLQRTPECETPAQLVKWLLADGSDPTGDEAMKPLMPTHRGEMQWRIGSLHEKWKWSQQDSRSLDLMRRQHEFLIEEDYTHGRKFLGAAVLKTGLASDLLLPQRMRGEVEPLKPETVVSESFTQSNSTTINADNTWTERGSNFQVVSNRLRRTTTTATSPFTVRFCYCDTALSSDDMIVRATIPTNSSTGSSQSGVTARDATGATTYYYFANQSSGMALNKVVAGSFTELEANAAYITDTQIYLGFLIDGSTQLVFNTELEGTDTAITANTRAGALLHNTSSVANCEMDDWEARDMVETASGGSGGVKLVGRGGLAG